MKATVKTLELRAAIAKVGLAIPKRATLPVLKGVLLKAQDSHLLITGCDMEKLITAAVKARVTHGGALVVPVIILRELLGKIKADTITVETSKHTLKIEASGMVTSIEGQDPKDYPPIPRMPRAVRPAPHLVEAMNTVLFAAATETTRPVLTTVCVKPNGGTTDFVTADGFRLARLRVRGKYPNMLVPRDSVTVAGKVLSGEGGSTQLEMLELRDRDIRANAAYLLPGLRRLLP